MSNSEQRRTIHHGVAGARLNNADTSFSSGICLGEGKKRCGRCGGLYPGTTEFFYCNKRKKDGLDYMCKECDKERKREYHKSHPDAVHKGYLRRKAKYGSDWINEQNRKQYHKDIEKSRKYSREKDHRRRSNPEIRAREQKQDREYYQANIEKCRKKGLNYYYKNRERILKQKKEKRNGYR